MKDKNDSDFSRRDLLKSYFAIMSAGMAGLATDAAAEDSMTSETTAKTLGYARLYVDDKGVSHFDDAVLPLTVRDYSPPANPIAVHALQDLHSATFVLLPQGADEDWHPAPRRQLAVISRGTVEVTAGDGENRLFGPGTMVLLEDTSGTGHQTRVVGDEDSLTLMVAVG